MNIFSNQMKLMSNDLKSNEIYVKLFLSQMNLTLNGFMLHAIYVKCFHVK